MVVMTREEGRAGGSLEALEEKMDDGFRELRVEVSALRVEIGDVREGLGGVRAEIQGLRETMDARFETVDARFETVDAKFDALNRTLQIGFGLIGSFLGVLGILIATQL